jgi:Raf kinase inhibitor-like YbhB/YbcL family protein
MPRRFRLDPGCSMALLAVLLALAVPAAGRNASPAVHGPRFTLSSPDLTAGGSVPLAHVYNRDGCRGRNISPAVDWRHPPAGTRGFALFIVDSDVRGGWWHWLVIDIPAGVRSLPAGAGAPGGRGLPAGAVQTRNDWGFAAYGGPCPPAGPPHHYHVVLYALGARQVAVSNDAPAGAVAAAVRAAAIAEAEITVIYGR